MPENLKPGTQVSKETFYDMLGAVPPAAMSDGAFLVGECYCHDHKGNEVFHCYLERIQPLGEDQYFYMGLMTIDEFKRGGNGHPKEYYRDVTGPPAVDLEKINKSDPQDPPYKTGELAGLSQAQIKRAQELGYQGFVASRECLNDAFAYCNLMLNTLHEPEAKLAASTAIAVLVNTYALLIVKGEFNHD